MIGARGWNRFWFAPGSAKDLAISRILFFTGFVAFSLLKSFHEWGTIPPFFHEYRATYLLWMGVPVPGTGVLLTVEWAWRLALVFAAIGLFTRSSCLAAALGSLFLMGLDAPEVAGRSYTAGVFVPLILGFSRCGDTFSLDNWLRQRRGHPQIRVPEEYGWPVQLVRVFLAYIFFAAGFAKIRYGGFPGWMRSGTISDAILQAAYWYSSRARPGTNLGPWLLHLHPRMGLAVAGVAQFAELLYPCALFSRQARKIVLPLMATMLIGFWLCLGPFFYLTLLAHVFWIPWSAWLGIQDRQPGAQESAAPAVAQ